LNRCPHERFARRRKNNWLAHCRDDFRTFLG
jgi:hypothetical protein